MSKTQKDAFISYEADGWFRRNSDDKHYDAESDFVIKVLQEYKVQPESVLELGCSTGYRLHAISKTFRGARVAGIEPSTEAIKAGREQYPEVEFVQGTADDLKTFPSGTFDLVVIGFVLYVVDRELLLKTVAETDRVLANGGILMIIDFFAERPVRNPYQHIKDMQAFAYKQNYEEIFTSSKLYHLMDRRSMSHLDRTYDLSDDFYNKYTMVTLRKDLAAGYK